MKHDKSPTGKNIFTSVLFLLSVALTAETLPSVGPIDTREIIGYSVEDREIRVDTIGSGPVDILIVGGIHGGYEANSVVLARRVARHFRENSEELDPRFTLHIIDLMNPDGLYRITGGVPAEQFNFRAVNTRPGRFNANMVDLNRNWGADWKPVSYWGTTQVNTGTGPWSEPETRAVREIISKGSSPRPAYSSRAQDPSSGTAGPNAAGPTAGNWPKPTRPPAAICSGSVILVRLRGTTPSR
jgi:hypothetical protein